MANLYTQVFRESDVVDSKSFALYTQQTLGVPLPNYKEWATLNKALKVAFERHPGLTYQSMCRVVQWARARRRRPPHCHQLVGLIRYAWHDGCLPELDPGECRDGNVEYEIAWALEREEDPEWRRRLLITQGMKARADELRAWKQRSQPVSVPGV